MRQHRAAPAAECALCAHPRPCKHITSTCTNGDASTPSSPAVAAELMQLLRHMSRTSENVGERLPEEARRIHYGETEARDIRGQASAEELEALLDEGIMVLPLPPPEDDLH